MSDSWREGATIVRQRDTHVLDADVLDRFDILAKPGVGIFAWADEHGPIVEADYEVIERCLLVLRSRGTQKGPERETRVVIELQHLRGGVHRRFRCPACQAQNRTIEMTPQARWGCSRCLHPKPKAKTQRSSGYSVFEGLPSRHFGWPYKLHRWRREMALATTSRRAVPR